MDALFVKKYVQIHLKQNKNIIIMQSTIITHYINIKKYLVNYYTKLITKLFGYQELKIANDNSILGVTLKYTLYRSITKYINIIKYIRSYTDITTDSLHIIKLFPENKNALIINGPSINFKDLSKTLNNVDDDSTMINVIVMKFDLINGDESLCLKNMVTKYKDTHQKYDNTMLNILTFNNINYNDDSMLEIKLMRNKKIVSKKVLLSDVINNHINHFLYVI
jgi:hypothetical protein